MHFYLYTELKEQLYIWFTNYKHALKTKIATDLKLQILTFKDITLSEEEKKSFPCFGLRGGFPLCPEILQYCILYKYTVTLPVHLLRVFHS